MSGTSAQSMGGEFAAELAILHGQPIFDNGEPVSTPNANVQPTPVAAAPEPAPTPAPEPEPASANDDPNPEPTNTEPDGDGLFDLETLTVGNDPAPAAQPQVDPYEEIYSKFNITEKGKEGLEKFIQAKNEEVEQLRKATEEVFANDKFKAANEIAKTLGETESLEYLGLANINYDAIDNETLLRWNLSRRGVSDERASEYLESLPDVSKEIEAQILRDQLKSEQSQRLDSYRSEAAQAAERRAKAINETLANLKEVASVKVSNEDRAKIAKSIASGELMSKYGLSIDSKADVKKAVEAAAILELFPKVLQVAKQLSTTKGKAEVLNKLSNVQPNSNPTPTNAGTRLSESDQHINDLKQGKGLYSLI